eukprot:PITA_24915
MGNQEREASIRAPIFDGSNFVYWKIRTTTYLESLGTDVWGILEGGYTYPLVIPTDTSKRKQYELNAKAVTVLLESLSQSEFVKVMQFKSAKNIWDKIILSYEGDDQILSLKEDLKESKNQNKETLEEQEHEVLELRQQVEEGRKAEENIRKQYLEKEEQHQVKVNILKGKLEEKDKLL